MIELLSPVGDFETLKAAVQNGADSVYFGADQFSARAFASNFDLENLKKAIIYSKIRGVKTNLTLNTLIKNDEFEDAMNLASKVYEYGIDAIIVQDLGLGLNLIKTFPDLAIHASTQMTVHNLDGVLELERLGFKRVVLSRELSVEEINYICQNSNIEIECFIHGALCICYSGQCLFSSMIGGRSGNRGKCAQPCRLPYKLLENNTVIDNGYLLSTRDLIGLEYIPSLIKCGVECVKIEGRMKSPEYVATVTRIYRKYIDLAISDKKYIIEKQDKKDLLQVFNRGLSSSGHLGSTANKNLIFDKKPNNMGLPLGKVDKYNKNKGYITLKLKENLSIGDCISIQNEIGSYNISELMENNINIKNGKYSQIVTIGRMKGNINIGDNIYKLSSKSLTKSALNSFSKENKKIGLKCKITIVKNKPININIKSADQAKIYKDLNINCSLDVIPIDAKNQALEKSKVISQINKTSSTPYEFKDIQIELEKNIFLPNFSALNQLRRLALQKVEEFIISKITRKSSYNNNVSIFNYKYNCNINTIPKISLLLNVINLEFDYSKLKNVDSIYIPFKFFNDLKYENIINIISNNFDTFIYMPTIIKNSYINIINNTVQDSIKKYKIKGFVISNISNFIIFENLLGKQRHEFEFVANYTFNIFNNKTITSLENMGINRYTISPELDKNSILNLSNINKEIIVYGKAQLMNINYCLFSKSNKCYNSCNKKCNENNTYYLRDRLNMNFRILYDNRQTITTIYNSKTTSISYKDLNTNFVRIDILDENINQINYITSNVKNNIRFEGEEYTNANLNKLI